MELGNTRTELTFESVKAAVREALLEELSIGSYDLPLF